MSSSEREPRFDWNDLKIFHALVSAGSMSKAARLLGVVQPTVSRRLEQLEMRIGARLVTRGADGVELTDVGERIWTLVQTMQSTANDIGRVAGQADMAEAGRVRVTAPDGIASYWIAKQLPGFVEANPLIKLELSTVQAGEKPIDPYADVTLQYTQNKRMDLVPKELATLHFVPFTSRAYLDTYGRPDGLVDALMHRLGDLVSYEEETRDAWPSDAQAIKKMMKPSLTTDSSSVLLEAIRSGSIIAMAPTYIAQRFPDLVFLDLDLVIPVKLWMFYHPEQRRVTRVRKVLEWLDDIFDTATYPWFRKDFVPPAEFSEVETVTARGERPKPRIVK